MLTAGFAEMDRIPRVPQRVIDTHIHLWDPDRLAYPWLSAGFDDLPGRYLPRDFQRDAADVNLIATVHVQAEIDHDLDPVLETEWLDELADAHETPTAIIGYADLRDPALDDVLARQARSTRTSRAAGHARGQPRGSLAPRPRPADRVGSSQGERPPRHLDRRVQKDQHEEEAEVAHIEAMAQA